ncbi:MAG: hypothetical protein ABI370_04930, partial [Gammaproteobacteria bacterium]
MKRQTDKGILILQSFIFKSGRPAACPSLLQIFFAFVGANLRVRPLYQRNNVAYLGRGANTQVRPYKSSKTAVKPR